MPIFSSVGIETGEPFVEQQNLRIGRKRARQLDALLVDIGQRRHRANCRRSADRPAAAGVGIIVELLAPAPGVTEHAAGGDVLEHGHRRQHAHQLEGAGHAFAGDPAGADAGDLIAVEPDLAALGFNAPEIKFIIVVLPEPFGPIRPRTSFSAR
jgi:hypothetical protein